MKIEREAKLAIKEECERIGGSSVQVGFKPVSHEEALARIAYGGKAKTFNFPRLSGRRNAIPEIVTQARKILEDLGVSRRKDAIDGTGASMGSLGLAFQDALAKSAPTEEPKPAAPELKAPLPPIPYPIRANAPRAMAAAARPASNVVRGDFPSAGGKKAQMSHKAAIEVYRLLSGEVGQMDGGFYVYKTGESDETVRDRIDPRLNPDRIAVLRKETFGLLATEQKGRGRPRGSTGVKAKDLVEVMSRIEFLEARVEALEKAHQADEEILNQLR